MGRLEPDSDPGFSVINGAQTLSICSKYAFEWEYRRENCQDDEQEAVKRLRNFEKAQVLLRVIHIPLRAGKGSSEEEREKLRLANEISIALNRQKPVKQEDIAFTTPFVQKMQEYLESQPEPPFLLVRRGEDRGYPRQLDLVAFSKARLACIDQPGKARTVSNGEILQLEFGGDNFRREDIFVKNWLADDAEQAVKSNTGQDAVFRRHYGAVLFASQLEDCYKRNRKAVQKAMQEAGCGENEFSALGNGSWYFTALLVQLLNGFSTDYARFNCAVRSVEDRVPDAMRIFADMIACCAAEKQTLNSNDFKKEELYKAALKKLQKAKKGSPFQKFRELFGVFLKEEGETAEKATEEAAAEAAPGAIQIAYGPSFVRENPEPVKTVADAFVRTVEDILVQFAPSPAELANFSAWLTSSREKCSTSPYYTKNPPSIVYRGKTYWVGTSISNDSKYLYLNRLCSVAGVPSGEISWKKGDDILYEW